LAVRILSFSVQGRQHGLGQHPHTARSNISSDAFERMGDTLKGRGISVLGQLTQTPRIIGMMFEEQRQQARIELQTIARDQKPLRRIQAIDRGQAMAQTSGCVTRY